MSKPYLSINSLTYSAGLLSLNYTATRLRGGGTIRIDGFSNSISLTQTRSFARNVAATFSVSNLGTSSTSTTTDPTVVWTFGATAANGGTNIKFYIGNQPVCNTTASGITLSNYLDTLVSELSFTAGTSSGFRASLSHSGLTSSLTFTAPAQSGNYFNGIVVSAAITRGTSTFTWSVPNGVSALPTTYGTFSGGSTTYNTSLNFPRLMEVPSDRASETSKTASILP